MGLTFKAAANGFLLPDQDAFATARGEAFVATADNASAVYYNPAGVGHLQGNNFRAGAYTVYLNPSYERPGSETAYYNQDKLTAVPQFFYTYGQADFPLKFGLGVYSPFGLRVEWPQDTGFRTLATQGSLTYVTINPVMALELAPNFSVGVGVMANHANINLQSGLVWPAQSFDEFQFTGDGWGVGYNLGVLWQPADQWSLGLTFRSGCTMNLKGHTDAHNNVPLPSPPAPFPVPAFNYQSSANADFSFPMSVAFGVSYRPTEKWNVEVDANYVDWSSLGTVTIKQSSSLPPLLPQNIPYVLDWQASWLYELGATRYFGHGWQASAGYVFNGNSVPSAHYNPYVSDLNRSFFSLGTGYKGARFNFDIAYQFGYGPERTVTGSAPSATGQTANGDYGFISQAFLVSVGMHF
jgi:long-chain fatty acid transport protein